MTTTFMSLCLTRIEDRDKPDPDRLWSYCSFAGNMFGLEDHYKAKGYDICHYTRLPPERNTNADHTY
jgi:hypothetical protein